MNFKEANRVPNLDDYIRFDFNSFFKSRSIRISRVLSLHPFVLDCYIHEDRSDDGNDNTGKHVKVSLSRGLPIKAGVLLSAFYNAQQKGETPHPLAVRLDGNYSTSRQSRTGALNIITPMIQLVDKDRGVEIYSVPSEDSDKKEEKTDAKQNK